MGIMVFVLSANAYALSPGIQCQACMSYISCNASQFFYNNLDETNAKNYCDANGTSAVKAMVAERPNMCADLANLGWQLGQEYRYGFDTGNSADTLQGHLHDMALIAARRCLDYGICGFPAAGSFWIVVGMQNDAQQALAMTIVFNSCPDSGQSSYGDNFTANKCYITGNFSDDTGAGEYTDKCYWASN